MKEVHHIGQGLTNFSIKTQIVNTLDFTGQKVSVTIINSAVLSQKHIQPILTPSE